MSKKTKDEEMDIRIIGDDDDNDDNSNAPWLLSHVQ